MDLKSNFHDENDEESLPDNQITDILNLDNGNFIVSSFGGVSEYDILKDKFYSLNILPDDTLVYALEKINSNEFLIGTYRKGLYRYNKLTGSIINYRLYRMKKDYSISDNFNI